MGPPYLCHKRGPRRSGGTGGLHPQRQISFYYHLINIRILFIFLYYKECNSLCFSANNYSFSLDGVFVLSGCRLLLHKATELTLRRTVMDLDLALAMNTLYITNRVIDEHLFHYGGYSSSRKLSSAAVVQCSTNWLQQ